MIGWYPNYAGWTCWMCGAWVANALEHKCQGWRIGNDPVNETAEMLRLLRQIADDVAEIKRTMPR